jgi:hypothetical protein
VNGRHVGNGVRVAAWEARWLWPPLPPPCHGNGSGDTVDGGGTQAQWRDSVADGRCNAGGSMGGQVASPHPPAPCSYLAVMEGVDGAGARGHAGGTFEGSVASTALSSLLSDDGEVYERAWSAGASKAQGGTEWAGGSIPHHAHLVATSNEGRVRGPKLKKLYTSHNKNRSFIVFVRQNSKIILMGLVMLIELGCDVTMWGWIRSISRPSFD